MRKNRVINQGFTRSRKFRVDIMYIIYDNMITSRNMNFLIMATTAPLSLCGRGDLLESREWLEVSHMLTSTQGEGYIPSGNLTFCHGKLQFFMGKFTISMAIFNSYFDITRGYIASNGVGSAGPRPPTRHTSLACDALRSVDEMGFLNDNER